MVIYDAVEGPGVAKPTVDWNGCRQNERKQRPPYPGDASKKNFAASMTKKKKPYALFISLWGPARVTSSRSPCKSYDLFHFIGPCAFNLSSTLKLNFLDVA